MTLSETVSKKKGRPLAIPEQELDALRPLFPDITSRRGLQNRAYTIRALSLFYSSLGDPE